MAGDDAKPSTNEVEVLYNSTRKEMPTFSGARGERLEEWVEAVELHLVNTRYPKAQRSAFLLEHISGDALRELRCEGLSAKSEWSSLVDLLRQCYGKRRPKWGDFYSIVQRVDQSLAELSLELRERYAELVPDSAQRKKELLKERMSEAVREVSLKDEAGRLIREAGDISFFTFVERLSAYRGVHRIRDDETSEMRGRAVRRGGKAGESRGGR